MPQRPSCRALLACAVIFLASGASALGAAPQSDANLSRLAEPAVAASLRLTDAQKQQVADIISARDAALKSGDEAAKAAAKTDAEKKLTAVMDARQTALFQSLFAGTRIRFNFRAQKWEQVLDYIADEAGLSLAMSEPPPGVFNYSDSKEYTPSEAIDLINGWLLTKGYTLIRRERLLMCLPLKDGLPANAVPRIKPEELATRGRFEIVSVLLPLEGRPIDKVQTELEAIKGTYGKITPLAATGQILITGTAGNVKAMQALAKAVPIPPAPAKPKPKPKPTPKPPAPKPPPPVMKVYPIKHSNPGKLQEILSKFVKGTMFFDEQAGQITINAVPSAHKTAEDIIKRLEANEGPDKQPSLKLYPIRTRDVDQLMATLELATPSAKLRMEENGRRLVAWATPQEQTKVQAVLEQLKASTAGTGSAGTQLQTYPIERVQPSTAKALLEELLPNARITANDEGKTLIVIGTLDDHQAVKTLVTQIDGQKRERSAKTYSIKGIAADRLTTVATTLVPLATLSLDAKTDTVVVVGSEEEQKLFSSVLEQLTATATGSTTELKTYPTSDIDVPSVTALLATLAPKASVTVDATNARLVVIATPEDHTKLANVLTQVTQAPEAARDLKPYPLPQNQSTETITGLLATIAPSASVTVDAANKRFLVVANAKEHELVAKTLEQFAAGVAMQRELKPYPLAEGQNSETLISLLSSLAAEATVTPDTTNSRLLIVATPDEHAKVAATIEQFGDAAPNDQLQFYSIDETVDSTAVLPLITELVPKATVRPDSANKQLAVVASVTDHAKIKNILTQASTVPVTQRELKSYALAEQQDPTTLTSLLSSLVPNASVTVDSTNRRLLIVANETEHSKAAKVLEQLGGDMGAAPELRFYPVQQEVLSGVTTVLSSVAPAAQITLDETARRLSVVARAAEHERIKATLDKLTLAAAANEKPGMQLYDVTSEQRRRFTTVAAGLTEQLPGMQIIASGDPRELTIWAKPSQHEVVTRILEQLKRDVPLARKPILAVYPITKVDAAGVQTALAELFPDAQITLDEKASRLLIKAVPDQQKAIDNAVKQLDTDSPVSTKIKLMAYPVDGLTSTTVVAAIEAELPNVSIIPDTAAETLIVRGQLRDHEKVAAIIDALRSSAGTLRKRRVVAYPAVFGNPLQTITFINTAFDGARAVVDSTSGRMTVWATDEQHKEIAAAVAEMSGRGGGRTCSRHQVVSR